MKSNFKLLLGYLLAAAVLIGAIALVYRGTTGAKEKITEADFIEALVSEEVAVYTLDYNKGYLLYQEFVKDKDGNFLDVKGNIVNFPQDEDGNITSYELPEGVELKLGDTKQIILADITVSRLNYIDEISLKQAESGTGVGILDDYDIKPANTYPWWCPCSPPSSSW